MPDCPRIGTILAIAVVLLVLGFAVRDGRVLSITIPFLVYAGFALLGTGESLTPEITLSRNLSTTRTTEGETVDVTVNLTNTGQPIPWIRVAELIAPNLSVTQGKTTHFAKLDTGEQATFSYTLRVPRGLHTLPGADITTWSKITLTPKHKFLRSQTNILAIPIVEPIGDIDIRPERSRLLWSSWPHLLSLKFTQHIRVWHFQHVFASAGQPVDRS